jgi:NitT/TauT family transport system permease protein
LIGVLRTRLLSAAALLLVWEVAAQLAHSRMLPSPATVFTALGHEAASGALAANLGVTLARVAASFALAMVLGTALGIAMGRLKRLDRVLDMPLTALLNLPALVVIVLIYIWFGLSEAALVVAVALNKLPATTVTLREGARTLDPALAEMAQSFRFSRWATLRHVVMPQLTPYLFAAARSGLALIWKIVLVAELLGRSNGVGFEIQVQFQLFDIAGILAYTLAFVAVVQVIEWGILQPLERWTMAWR